MTPLDRFKASVAAIVRELVPETRFHGNYEYRVDSCSGGTFSGRPTDDSFGLPDASGWPVRAPVTGGVVTLPKGSLVVCAFVNGDPARPFIYAFEATASPTNVAIKAGTQWTVDAPTIGLVSNGVRVGTLSATEAMVLGNKLVTWLTAHTHTSASAGSPTTPPLNLATISTITSTKHKLDA